MLLLVMAFVPSLFAQIPIDGVLLRLGADVITVSDVRQARLLKLVDAPGGSDQAFVDALVKRRLILEEIKRNPPVEPATAAVDAKWAEWVSKVGGETGAAALLGRAGLTEASLRQWLRDDLRIEAYLNQRFPASADRARAIAAWIDQLRQRVGIR